MKFNQKNPFHYISYFIFIINFSVSILFSILILRPKRNTIYLSGHKLIGNLEVIFNNQKNDQKNIFYITLNIIDYFSLKKKYTNTKYSSNIKTFLSPIDVFNFISSKVIVASHGLLFNKILVKYFQVVTIYCGHAIDGVYPVNKIKYFKHLKNFTEVWLYSPYELDMYVNDFKYPYKNLKPIGYPRVQYLSVAKEKNLEFKKQFKIKKNIILYAPTSNRGNYNYLKSDLNLYNINTLKILEDFLNEIDSIFIIKLHINDKLSDETKKFINQSNFLFESDSFKVEFDYDLLILSDMLITDYSTIYVDYLILDKPILFVKPPDPNLNWKYTFIVNNEFIDRKDSLQGLFFAIKEKLFKNQSQKELIEINKRIFKNLEVKMVLDSVYRSLEAYLD